MKINIFPYTSWCNKKDCKNNIFFSLEEAHSSERKLDLSLKIYFCYGEYNLIQGSHCLGHDLNKMCWWQVPMTSPLASGVSDLGTYNSPIYTGSSLRVSPFWLVTVFLTLGHAQPMTTLHYTSLQQPLL